MEVITFKLSGKTAFLKKPDVNEYAYFTYTNIHKVAILGILGAIIGLEGYIQQHRDIAEGKEILYPEFYEKLNGLQIGIIPLGENGYFSKKIQIFNNSVGYASSEKGGNLIVREQWLEDPSWLIYIVNSKEVQQSLFEELEYRLLNQMCAFIPYLGKNDHPATISDVKVCKIEDCNGTDYVQSLFPLSLAELSGRVYNNEKKFVFREMMPYSLDETLNSYEFKEMCFTNLCFSHTIVNDKIFKIDGKVVYCE